MKLILLIALASNTALGNAIKWRSKGLTFSTQGNVIHLDNGVEIEQGTIQVQADTARIYFDGGPRKVGREAIVRVELQGQVRFSFGKGAEKISGSCDKAELLPAESIVLSGRAQATQGGNTLRGAQIIYYLHTGWIKVSEAEGVIRTEPQ